MESKENIAAQFLQALKKRYPEIEEMNRSSNPDDHEHLWIRVYAPMNDDRKAHLQQDAATLEIDILLQYDYRISVIPYQSQPYYS